MSNRRYKCPLCDKYDSRENLITHVSNDHKNEINDSPARIVFNSVNNKTHGSCVICGRTTDWNEDVFRYNRFCSKRCRSIAAQRAKENMLKIYGKTTLLDDPEQQKKMLANRSISGKYKFENKTFTYTGSYEHKLLEFMDRVLHLDPNDIEMPGPIIEYINNGKKRFWITDCYYIPYNLIIEIKDGGSNPNKRSMEEYRKKQLDKENALIRLGGYNYLRLTNNNMAQLLDVFIKIKLSLDDINYKNGKYKIININENSDCFNYFNDEFNELIKDKVMSTKTFNEKFSKMDEYEQQNFLADLDDKTKLTIIIFNNHEKEFSNYTQSNKIDMCSLILLYLLDLINLDFIKKIFNTLGDSYENLYVDLLTAKK